MHETNTACVVTNIDGEPDLLNRQPCLLRHTMPICCQGSKDVVHDSLAEEDHTKPAEAWNEAQLVWFGLIETAGGVTHAEALVTTEDESLGGF